VKLGIIAQMKEDHRFRNSVTQLNSAKIAEGTLSTLKVSCIMVLASKPQAEYAIFDVDGLLSASGNSSRSRAY
jgi:hypothetical protein